MLSRLLLLSFRSDFLSANFIHIHSNINIFSSLKRWLLSISAIDIIQNLRVIQLFSAIFSLQVNRQNPTFSHFLKYFLSIHSYFQTETQFKVLFIFQIQFKSFQNIQLSFCLSRISIIM